MKEYYLNNYAEFVARTFGDQGSKTMNIVHAGLGASSEAGEVADLAKKVWLYDAPIDLDKFTNEIGDVLFYLQGLCSTLGISLDDAKAANIDKLLKRFPDGFTKEHALKRLDKE